MFLPGTTGYLADSAGVETKIRVLHIDDDPEFGDLTATYLERTDGGISVESVTDVGGAMDTSGR